MREPFSRSPLKRGDVHRFGSAYRALLALHGQLLDPATDPTEAWRGAIPIAERLCEHRGWDWGGDEDFRTAAKAALTELREATARDLMARRVVGTNRI